MNRDSLQQIAETICDDLCRVNNLKPVTVKVKSVKKGCAYFRTRFISIPIWPYKGGGVEYFTAYVIHEMVHFILNDTTGNGDHGDAFKLRETRLLREYGLVPKRYARAYYKRLETTDGRLCWIWRKSEARAAGLTEHELET
jgi:predicted SprT family Zn-dependent metalloprotease